MAARPEARRRSNGGPRVLAALDIGTNSFHLMVARLNDVGFDVISREREMVRLGQGGGDMKHLSADAIDRGIAALGRMQRVAEGHGAVVRAVATSAVREADNAGEFIARARAEAGVDVEVVSGAEEARLIYLGVLQAVPAFEHQVLVVDIGGGSTEVLVGRRGVTAAARSFKLGAVRLTDRFFPGGKVSGGAVSDCRAFIRSVLSIFQREVNRLGFEMAIASSGTAEAVARMVSAAAGNEPVTLNRFEFTSEQVNKVVKALLKRGTAASRRSVAGLDPGRADIIVAGALVLEAVAEVFTVDSFVHSDGALREGVLLDTIERHTGGGVHHLRDVSRRSVQALAQRCDDDPQHSAHVASLALQLFAGTQALHELPAEAADYLEAAALLANVGLVISHSKHHLHSYYVIRQSELTGLTDEEIEIIAQIARYHRKSAPKASHPAFAALNAEHQRLVRGLAAILRVAIGLDRAHDQRVSGLDVHGTDGAVRIEVRHRPGSDIGLELYTANERSALLADTLGRPVEVVAAG